MTTTLASARTHAQTIESVPLDTDVKITAIDLPDRYRFRMLELGLRIGTIIRVTQRSNAHGRVVARGVERIALDGGTARCISVEPLNKS